MLLRPRVAVAGDDLVLRNMVSTTWVPLASIDELEIRQMLTVLAGGRRFQSTSLNRRRQGVLRGSRSRRAAAGDPSVEVPTYADLVEGRLRRLVEEARSRAGDDTGAPGVRRDWAVPEIAGLTALTVLLVVLLVL